MNIDAEKKILDLFVKGNYSGAKELYGQELKQPGYLTILDDNNSLTKYGLESCLRLCQLGEDLNEIIVSALNNNHIIKSNKETKDRLIALKLVTNDGKLTQKGYYKALEKLPLEAQCEYLDIDISELFLPQINREVEVDVINRYKNKGWHGKLDEGSSFEVLIRATCLDLIIEMLPKFKETQINYCYNSMVDDNKKSDEEFSKKILDRLIKEEVKIKREMNFPLGNLGPPLEDYPYWYILKHLLLVDQNGSFNDNVKQQINKAIYKIRDEKVFDNLKAINEYRNTKWKKMTPELVVEEFDINFIYKTYLNLGKESFLKLADLWLDGYLDFGWPDIIFIKDEQVVFMEVKIKDNLHFSQIQTLDKINPIITRLGVLKVGRPKGTYVPRKGCVKGDCINGTGTFIGEYGFKYTGQFKNGKPHGKGEMVDPLTHQTGTFSNGHLSEGVLIRKNIEYVGKFHKGTLHDGYIIEKNEDGTKRKRKVKRKTVSN